MKRSVRRFALHYLQMIIAMLAGMAVLYGIWTFATAGISVGWLRSLEVQTFMMATAMALGMAIWMRIRHHRWREVIEMSLSMYPGFVVLYPFYLLSMLSADDFMMLGHLLMLPAMLVPMLARIDVYAGAHHHAPKDEILAR